MDWKSTFAARARDVEDDFSLPTEIRTEAVMLTPSPSRQIIVDFYENIYGHLSESYAGMAEALNEEAGLRSKREADLANVKLPDASPSSCESPAPSPPRPLNQDPVPPPPV